jgi:LCP family protein required for cell wall assembly
VAEGARLGSQPPTGRGHLARGLRWAQLLRAARNTGQLVAQRLVVAGFWLTRALKYLTFVQQRDQPRRHSTLEPMPNRPGEPDGADYDWLYGKPRDSKPDDATTRIPAAPPADPKPDDATTRKPAPPADPKPDDATTRMPVQSRDPFAPTPPPGGPGGPSGAPNEGESERTMYAPAPGPPPGGTAPARSPHGAAPPPGGDTPGGLTAGAPPPAVKRRRLWLRIIVAILVVWLLFLIAVPIWAWSRIDKVDAEPSGDRPADQPGVTYLMVGSDSREGLSKEELKATGTGGVDVTGGRTDTIMLLHTGDGPPLLMSIPRDSEVDIPGHGTSKINAAFAYGGPELLVRTIEQDTGIRVDDYIEIGFGGFVNIVDAVGGVEICPKTKVNDRRANLHLDKGCQNVNGATALGWARSRHAFKLSDLARAEHQREVLSGIADKAASPWTIVLPWRYFNIAHSGAGSLTLGDNVTPWALANFAWTMSHIGSNGLRCTVPITDASATTWDPDRAPEVFKFIIADQTDKITKALCTPAGV